MMFTRYSFKLPLYYETLHHSLEELVQTLIQDGITTIHFPIIDAERLCNNVESWYWVLTDCFADTGFINVMHDRIYMSIASITENLPPTLSNDYEPGGNPHQNLIVW